MIFHLLPAVGQMGRIALGYQEPEMGKNTLNGHCFNPQVLVNELAGIEIAPLGVVAYVESPPLDVGGQQVCGSRVATCKTAGWRLKTTSLVLVLFSCMHTCLLYLRVLTELHQNHGCPVGPVWGSS